MADYVPHPLITRVGMHVFDPTLNPPASPAAAAAATLVNASDEAATVAQATAKTAVAAVRAAAKAAKAPPAGPAGPARPAGPAGPAGPGGSPAPIDPIEDDDTYPDDKRLLAEALSDRVDVPELSLFAGFLAGQVKDPQNEKCQLVYLDARLNSWLVVKETDIAVHERMTDDHAPYGVRDVLWVRRNATLIQGTGSRSNQGRFLVGELTGAGDFAASTTGGTFSAATGLLCEATTPGCCYSSRTR